MLRKAALSLGIVGALLGGSSLVVGLEADLSHHLVAITTAFSGTDVLLFGAIDQPGSDVAVVVRGPLDDQEVQRKSRVGFIWLTTAGMRFRNVPGYYAVASSRPLDEIASPGVLQRHEIGVDELRLRPAAGQSSDPAEIASFRAALIRNKQRQQLYASEVGEVSFLGRSLFRTRLAFPANVPPGSYQVQVFQLQNGSVVSAQASPLGISKIGLEADLFDIAHRQAALYGLGAILLALTAGWSANIMFGRR
jgi:uncharacterized protein (TIGR02186 family)